MRFDPGRHHRRSVRLTGYDYAQAGGYFVTIVTKGRVGLFGDIVDGEMRLNECGHIASHEWLRTADVRPNVTLDAFVVMPNHIHGVIIINDAVGAKDVGAHRCAPLQLYRPPRSLGAWVAGFKSITTKRINALRHMPGLPVWQRNYYEHIIRSERSLERIRQYVAGNPARWAYDGENPAAVALESKDAWRC